MGQRCSAVHRIFWIKLRCYSNVKFGRGREALFKLFIKGLKSATLALKACVCFPAAYDSYPTRKWESSHLQFFPVPLPGWTQFENKSKAWYVFAFFFSAEFGTYRSCTAQGIGGIARKEQTLSLPRSVCLDSNEGFFYLLYLNFTLVNWVKCETFWETEFYRILYFLHSSISFERWIVVCSRSWSLASKASLGRCLLSISKRKSPLSSVTASSRVSIKL